MHVNIDDPNFISWWKDDFFRSLRTGEEIKRWFSRCFAYSITPKRTLINDKMFDWFRDNVQGYYTYRTLGDEGYYTFYFRLEKDLVLFELTWC